MKLRTINTVIQLMRSQGIWQTLGTLRNRLADKYIEYSLGISTSKTKTRQVLGLTDEERGYYPSDFAGFKRLMNALEIHEGDDVFVDFGAGMGRSVVLAGLHPFRRIIGVEISAELSAIAEANVNRALGKLQCRVISIVTSDAATFLIPSDMTVAYFFNPFVGSILDVVLQNIHRSLQEAPRQIRIVCNDYSFDSEFSQQIRKCPWLLRQQTIPLGTQDQVGSIYVNR